ncbi:DUF6508 domain-containing protein [Streptomyces sp. SBT349]|uniref:DUF6508 domain-containing protein n=1 Tax=Streptomyces sp. SBT349 TaxID=1580539 RepID=UPI00066DD642|nr:DUF6508 domain-containing protein [Streptomyces sp. SBT349]
MTDDGNPDDATLLAQLETSPDAWGRLLNAADAFAASPHAEHDVSWSRPEPGGAGSVSLPYPLYGERVELARRALAEVRAVTPAYHWTRHRAPTVPADGSPLSPADAVRLATALVRGERFGDGTIAAALERGAFQAALASLATWYRARPPA